MNEVAIGLGAFVGWVLLCALTVFLITLCSVKVGQKLEYYLVMTDRWTFRAWLVSLALSPAIAFLISWCVWGMFLPPEYYFVVRVAWIGAGVATAGGAIAYLCWPNGKVEDAETRFTLLGALWVDVICCSTLLWYFEPIARLMQSFYTK